MIYSIGSNVDFNTLHWSSDWNSTDIFGRDYPDEFVIGFYIDKKHEEISYYLNMEDGTVIAVFIVTFDGEVEMIWNEEYMKW